MRRLITGIKEFIKERFNLNEDKAEEAEIVENIRRDASFKGTNLWTLIFAIFIASIGLNVNSTAVIIGAMLISPLMGPIMAVGLAIGVNDIALLKKGVKNVTIAVIFSIFTSALYFYITPLHEASSELLARTNPTVWDVFIAFVGGLAGIVAGTRKSKSNVIPGVAIATALMPPLCTAGFGLAMGKWYFFLGALYLFFINSVFICLATFLIVKKLGFHKHEFETSSHEKKVISYIWVIAAIALLPSIYLAYRIVKRSIFENNAQRFVQKEFHFTRTQIVNKTYRMEGKEKTIDLLLIGQELPQSMIDSLTLRLPSYSLNKTRLIIRQGINAKDEIDLAQIKASILEDVFRQEAQRDTLTIRSTKIELAIPDLRKELKALYPTLRAYTLSQNVIYDTDSTRQDTVSLFTESFARPLPKAEKGRLSAWIKQRIQSDSVKVYAE